MIALSTNNATFTINKVINAWNASGALGGVFGTINYVQRSDTAGQVEKEVALLKEGAESLKSGVDAFFNKGITAAKAVAEESAKMRESFRQAAEFALKAPGLVASMFGFGSSSSSGGAGGSVPMSDAAKKILDEVNQKWAESTQSKLKLLDLEEQKLKQKVDEEVLDVAKAEEAKRKITETYAALRRELIQKQADEQKALQLSAIEGQRKLVEGDPFLTDLQKRERLLDLLKEENRLLEQNIEIKKRQVTDPNASDESKLLAEKQLQDLQMRRADTQQSITNTSAEGTMSGEFRRVLTDMGNQWGSWAHQIANTFQNVIGGAIDVISKGITGLILGTKTWGQALSEIGTSILNMIINAIVKMFVTWIVNMTVLRLLQKLFGTESNTQAAQSAAAWTPAAVAASIASYGAAATVGTASVVAGMAIAEAFAAGMSGAGGAFAEGGRPPMGAVSLVGERGPELFVPDRPGTIVPADVSAAIMRGVGGGTSGTGTTGAGGGGTNIHLGLLSDRSQVPAWARSAQGEAHLIDLVKKNIHLIQKG
ncbi:MAG TPA: hypothetical protein VLT16_00600 [Candidatus Limnocylindrales bacterium]|nr:hypothetical protein [Candidatus Limnocylindrales bacterium]